MTVGKEESIQSTDLLEQIESDMEAIWQEVSGHYGLEGSLDEDFRPVMRSSWNGKYDELVLHGDNYLARVRASNQTNDVSYEIEKSTGFLQKIGILSSDYTHRDLSLNTFGMLVSRYSGESSDY